MFIREPFKAPPGARTSYAVKYPKGRKPFPTLPEAEAFAKGSEARGAEGGWAEINMVVEINVSPRS